MPRVDYYIGGKTTANPTFVQSAQKWTPKKNEHQHVATQNGPRSVMAALATENHHPQKLLQKTAGDIQAAPYVPPEKGLRLIPFDLPLDTSGNAAPALKKFYQENGLMRLVTTEQLDLLYQTPSSADITQKLIGFYDKKFNLQQELGVDRSALERALLTREDDAMLENFRPDAQLSDRLAKLSQQLKRSDLQDLLQHLFGPHIALADDALTHARARDLTAALIQTARSEPDIYEALQMMGAEDNQWPFKVEFGVYRNPFQKFGAHESSDAEAQGFEVHFVEPKIEDFEHRAKRERFSIKLLDQALDGTIASDPSIKIVEDHLKATHTAAAVLGAIEQLGIRFRINGQAATGIEMASDMFLDPERSLISGLLPSQLSLSDTDPLAHLRNEAQKFLEEAQSFDALYKALGPEHSDVLKRAREFGFNAQKNLIPAINDVISTHEWARDLLDEAEKPIIITPSNRMEI